MSQTGDRLPQVHYVCVRVDDKTLIDYTAIKSSPHGRFTPKLLAQLGTVKGDQRVTYTGGDGSNLNYHVMQLSGVVYLCCCEKPLKQLVAFQLLDSMKQQYLTHKASGKIAIGLVQAMKRDVEEVNAGRGDKFAKLQTEIASVRDIMLDNVDQAILRQKNIEGLLDETEHLSEASGKFSANATELRRKMWWKNVKLLLLILLIVSVLIFIIVLVACGGFKFEKCK